MHAGANALLALSLVAVLATATWWVVHRPTFALRAVAIEPHEGRQLRYVSTPSLRLSALRRVSGSFFTVDLDAVRAGFESVPWVRRATVRRIWPNRLVVTIEEHRPFALWGDGRLMNTYGELFTANLAEAEEEGALPELSGPAGTQLAVLSRYEELRRWLAPLALSPRSVALSQRHAWTVRLDDGTQLLLGRDQGLPIEARVIRWVKVYPRVADRFDRPADVIDLRYPNGFAVRSVLVAVGEKPKPGAAGEKTRPGAAGGAAVAVGLRR
jgi:cell division protein FtsQ